MSYFDNVIGYEDIKTELIRICDMLKNPGKYALLGVCLPRGILLCGDPGMGKTLMAECFMAEGDCKVFTVEASVLEDNFIESLFDTFVKAKKEEKAIVYLDGIDKYVNEEKDLRAAIATLEFFDLCKDTDILILATANSIQQIPDSILCTGRFDKVLELEYPLENDAENIVKHFLGQKKIAEDVDGKEIADIMAGYSCADLEAVVNEAGIYAGFDGRDEISREDLIRSCLRKLFHSPECLAEESREDVMRSAVHEAGHAVICEVLTPGSVSLASVRSYTGEMGGIVNVRPSGRYSRTKEEMEQEIIRKLGGKAAIELVLGKEDVECGNDLSRAFSLVNRLVDDYCVCGFDAFTGKVNSEKLLARKEKLIAQEIAKYYNQAKQILTENRAFLDKLSAMLAEKKILTQREIEALEIS